MSVVLETWNSAVYRISMYLNEIHMKKVAFPWNMMLYSLVEIYQCFRTASCFRSSEKNLLNVEAATCCETLVNLYQTTGVTSQKTAMTVLSTLKNLKSH
jgi:hypothetical protein